ncbi:MAG TPA: hypothetical protein VGH28_30185 [Polyangiaceae bacterium]
MRGSWLLLALLLVPAFARAEAPGDWVAKMAPGASADSAKALEDGSFPVDQLGAELDLLANVGTPAKIAETLQAVQKASGPKYWSESFDLVAGLVALPSADADAYRALLGTACILQSLARDGSEAAVSRMILVAADHGGMLRFEVTRRVRALGDAAVAPLILAREDRRVRGFAWSTLDAMQKKIPGDAVQAKSDAALSAILAAYGKTKDMDALGAVASFISSERDEVRAAARAAVLAYGDVARPKLAETYANVMSAPPPADWDASRIAHAIFDAFDKQRTADVDGMVDDGVAKSASGDDAAAVAAFDKALARMPFHPRRALMAPAYARRGQALAATDRAAARAALQKSLELDPDGTRAGEARAELAVMDGQDLESRGIEDRAPFERALSFDPGNVAARDALDRIDARARESESRARKWKWAALCGAAFLVVLVLFARIPRRGKRE